MKPTTELAEMVRIEKGKHRSPRDGNCAMEFVAWMAHEEHSDHPACASAVIGDFVRAWNDVLDDETRQRLAPYLVRIVGTRGTPAQEKRRREMVWDWMLRIYVPTWLRAAGLHAEADDVVARGEPALAAARAAARDAAWNAWDAAGARDAVRDAVGAAAREAAGDAAGDAAGEGLWAVADAAGVAAWDAAGAVALAVAGDAWDALRPTVVTLQESAFDLLDRMIRVTEDTTPTVTADPVRVCILRERGVPV